MKAFTRSIASWRIWVCLVHISWKKSFRDCPAGTFRSKNFVFGTGIIISSFPLDVKHYASSYRSQILWKTPIINRLWTNSSKINTNVTILKPVLSRLWKSSPFKNWRALPIFSLSYLIGLSLANCRIKQFKLCLSIVEIENAQQNDVSA